MKNLRAPNPFFSNYYKKYITKHDVNQTYKTTPISKSQENEKQHLANPLTSSQFSIDKSLKKHRANQTVR